jgi:hypothetical protein
LFESAKPFRQVYDKYELTPQFLDSFEYRHFASTNLRLFALKNFLVTNGLTTQLGDLLNAGTVLETGFSILKLNRLGLSCK